MLSHHKIYSQSIGIYIYRKTKINVYKQIYYYLNVNGNKYIYSCLIN